MNELLLAKMKAKGWVAADADPSKIDVNDLARQKMASGDLSLDEFAGWCAEAKTAADKKAADAKAAAQATVKGMVDEAVGPLTQQITALVGALGALTKGAQASAGGESNAGAGVSGLNAGDLTADALANTKRFSTAGAAGVTGGTDGADAAGLFQKGAAAGSTNEPRVKRASEQWNHTKSKLLHAETIPGTHRVKDQPVRMWKSLNDYEEFDSTSQLERAKVAAWYAWKTRHIFGVQLPEHVVQLVKEIVNEDVFVGIPAAGENPNDPRCRTERRKLTEFERKAVLDSNTSGGDEAVPEFFDTAIITTPLLYGELAPYVNIIPMSRGSSVDGFSHGTPTFVSTASGLAVGEFDTSGFITAFDTSIFPATCAISWGLDFESDTLPNFGQSVLTQIGMEAQRWLDEQIAIGDGTTEPQGIFVATGTSVPSAAGTSGAFTYNDALNLAFGIGKAARNALGGNRVRYVMKDADYKQFMQIATGVTGDTRPIFGMAHQDYRLGEYPVSVQNNISAGNVAFCNLAAYRLYRRQSLQFMTSTEGSTLMLSNRKLVVARMRWGGKLTLPTTYCAQMTDGSIA